MSASAFAKCVGTVRAIFGIAREHGMADQNPVKGVSKARTRQKRLELPLCRPIPRNQEERAIGGFEGWILGVA
jgi:hypothetical protein